jgi:hypothetical protein
VRVHASEEKAAREVLPSVLGAPGIVELRLANENNAAIGVNATVTHVDFSASTDSALLWEMNAERRAVAPEVHTGKTK